MKQIDVSGNEIEIVVEPPTIYHISLKEQFRRKSNDKAKKL